ncbi:MAG TPA: AMP-binding protein [Sphingobium sp.]
MTLTDMVASAAAHWGDRPVLEFDRCGTILSFRALHEQTDLVAANLIDLGLMPGERVGLCMANIPQYPLSWFGILKAGGVVVPMNIAYRQDDAFHICQTSDVRFIICDEERAALFETLRPTLPDLQNIFVVGGSDENFDILLKPSTRSVLVKRISGDLTNLQFTSGTTGLPKGCMLTHRYWTELVDGIQRDIVEIVPQDVMLTAQSFSYIDPQWALVLCLHSGAKLVVLERFRPSEFWAKVVEYDVTFFYCLAAMPLMMLSSPPSPAEKQHKVRLVICSAIPPNRHAAIEERFGCPWMEGYGSTETGSDISVSLSQHSAYVGSGSIGLPLRHREVEIVDDFDQPVSNDDIGELVVRGPGMMRGYWRQPEATESVFRNGWYHTGDLATRSSDGRLYLVGRKRDMIRRAGENIAAIELETVLQQHPDVKLAACVAVPDAVRNEEVMALLVTEDDYDLSAIISFMKNRLATFKVPRYWKIVEQLPLTPSARVAKPEISRAIDSDVFDLRSIAS